MLSKLSEPVISNAWRQFNPLSYDLTVDSRNTLSEINFTVYGQSWSLRRESPAQGPAASVLDLADVDIEGMP